MGIVYTMLVILSSAGFLYFMGKPDKNSENQEDNDKD